MRFLLFIILLSCAFSCKTQKSVVTKTKATATTPTETRPPIHEYSSLYGEKDTVNVPIMHFEERTQHLGMVKKGEKRTMKFPFKNVGDADMSISIMTACECTTTNQDDLRGKIFKPGTGGVIDVVFDSSDKDYSELIDIEIILDQFYGPEEFPIIEKIYYDFDIEK